MLCSKFTQVLKATAGATEHVSMHSITFGVPLKYTERRSQSKRETVLPRHCDSKCPFRARWLECHCSYLTKEFSWSNFCHVESTRLPCDETVWCKVLQNMTWRQCCMWSLKQTSVQKIVMMTKGFLIIYLLIFWSDGSCAITLYPCLRSCVFPFVCAFGFSFPSAAGPAAARTSDCSGGGYHGWWKWKGSAILRGPSDSQPSVLWESLLILFILKLTGI